jgi:hypothetical protein
VGTSQPSRTSGKKSRMNGFAVAATESAMPAANHQRNHCARRDASRMDRSPSRTKKLTHGSNKTVPEANTKTPEVAWSPPATRPHGRLISLAPNRYRRRLEVAPASACSKVIASVLPPTAASAYG